MFIRINKIIFLITFYGVTSFQNIYSQTLNIGLYNNPPFITTDNNQIGGFTVDVINNIAKKENFSVIYHLNTYETNIDFLTLGLIDIVPVKESIPVSENLFPYLVMLNDSFHGDNKTGIPFFMKDNHQSQISLLAGKSIFLKILPPYELSMLSDFKFPVGSKTPGSPKYCFKLLIILILIISMSLLLLIHLPVYRFIHRTGREIISEFESPDFFTVIFKKLARLIKTDYFCIGTYSSNTLKMDIFSSKYDIHKSEITETIETNSSCFIYALKNRKNVYTGNCKKDLKQYVNTRYSLDNIDVNINSALIIPLVFNDQVQGEAALLDRKKNAFPFIRKYLFLSISKYITIALKNRKLINRNRELLSCIEEDKNKILKAKQEVEYLAQHDPLTNLPNRLYLNEFLNQAIKKSNRTGKKLAVIFIDMDNFKEANDTYGHQTGDKVLIAAANRFKNLLRESDIVIRFGGDEFIIILEDINSNDDVKQVTGKILSTCTSPVLTETADLSLSFSIGISIYPDNGSSADELIRKADIALYNVKNREKGNWEFYSE